MPEQRGYEMVTHDDLYRIRICPVGDRWNVKIHSRRRTPPAETAVDTHEHTLPTLEAAKDWAAGELAKVWLPALEERHDLRRYEDLVWAPVDC